MQEFTFDVYALDMWMQPDGCWQENNRIGLGKLSIFADDFDSIDEKSVLNAMSRFKVKTLLGIPHDVLPSSDRRKFFVDDPYGTGEWFEVGYRRGREPLYGLSLCAKQ